MQHDPGVGTDPLPEPPVPIGPWDFFQIAVPVDFVWRRRDDHAELAFAVVRGVDEDDFAAERTDGKVRPTDDLDGGPALEGQTHWTAWGDYAIRFRARMDERHIVAVEPYLDVATVGFGDDDADEGAGAEVRAVRCGDLEDNAISRALDDLAEALTDRDIEAAEVALCACDVGECGAFLSMDGGDGCVEIVAGPFEVGLS